MIGERRERIGVRVRLWLKRDVRSGPARHTRLLTRIQRWMLDAFGSQPWAVNISPLRGFARLRFFSLFAAILDFCLIRVNLRSSAVRSVFASIRAPFEKASVSHCDLLEAPP